MGNDVVTQPAVDLDSEAGLHGRQLDLHFDHVGLAEGHVLVSDHRLVRVEQLAMALLDLWVCQQDLILL